MPLLLLKDLPRYECLLEGAKKFPELDPSACETYLYLLRTGDEAVRVVERSLGEHNISSGRFSVLMLLWRAGQGLECSADDSGKSAGPRTPAELADAAGVTRATMTGLIDTLEKDDFVRRHRDPNDRRMMSVDLTPAGEELIKKLLPNHFRMMASLMETLTPEERGTLVRLLNKILQQAILHRDPSATT